MVSGYHYINAFVFNECATTLSSWVSQLEELARRLDAWLKFKQKNKN